MEVIKMEKPVASASGSKRTSNINTVEEYSLEARNAEIKAVSDVLEKEGIQHVIGTADSGDFIHINDNLALLNEYFYNAAIKQKEWKVRFLVNSKHTSHYKASNTDKILAKVKQLLA